MNLVDLFFGILVSWMHMINEGESLMVVIWWMSCRLVLRWPQFQVRQVIGSKCVVFWVFVCDVREGRGVCGV